jgi:hypothetical protein
MNPREIKRVLRWYPPTWRRQHGEELIAVLGDTYGDDKLSPRVRLSLIRSGVAERVRLWRTIFNTYTAYSISCAVIWGVILAAVWCHAGHTAWHTFAVFFGGWAIGWLSASIARVVYPPPKPRKPPTPVSTGR